MKNLSVEGLRGIGVLLVLIYHLFIRFPMEYLSKDISSKLLNSMGFLGVSIFLILSSYFLTLSTTADTGRDFKLFDFLKRKIIRLWPEYIIGISIIFIIVNLSNIPDRKSTVVDFLLNSCFINGFIGTRYIDSSHWYITTLIGITFVFGVIKKLNASDMWITYVVWMLCSAISLKLKCTFISTILGGGYVGIVSIGVVIGKISSKKSNKIGWIVVTMCAVAYLVASKSIYQLLACSFATVAALLSIYDKCVFLNNKILVSLGTVSYSTYIIHQNISYIIELNLINIIGEYNFFIPSVALTISLLLGTVLYHTVNVFMAKMRERILKLD